MQPLPRKEIKPPIDMNELIAQKIFEYAVVTLHHPDPVFLPEVEKIAQYYDEVEGEIIKMPLPDYENDLNDTMFLIDKLNKDGYGVEIFIYPKVSNRPECKLIQSDEVHWGHGGNIGSAVIDATLKAYQIELD